MEARLGKAQGILDDVKSVREGAPSSEQWKSLNAASPARDAVVWRCNLVQGAGNPGICGNPGIVNL